MRPDRQSGIHRVLSARCLLIVGTGDVSFCSPKTPAPIARAGFVKLHYSWIVATGLTCAPAPGGRDGLPEVEPRHKFSSHRIRFLPSYTKRTSHVSVACLSLFVPVAPVGPGRLFRLHAQRQDDEKGTESTEVSLDTDRTSLEGRWIVSASHAGQSNPLFLVEITHPPDAATGKSDFTVEQLDVNADAISSNSKLQSFKIDGAAIDLSFLLPFQDPTAPPMTLNFNGRFKDGIVLGTMQSSNGAIRHGRLLPTEATLLATVLPKTEKDRDRLAELLKSTDENRLKLLKEFVDTHRESPMSLDACDEILEQASRKKVEMAFVREVADAYLSIAEVWGPQMTLEARLDIARSLAKGDYPPEIVIENADLAEKMLTEADPRSFKKQLEFAHGQALLKFDDRPRQEQGVVLLKQLHDGNVFDKEVTGKLAAFMRTQDRVDEAIALYSELVALPPTNRELSAMQQASQEGRDPHAPKAELESALKDLWQKKHGNLDGLEQNLDHAFETAIDGSVTDKPQPRPYDVRNRVLVCELFTGSSCMPCIAADLAVARLARTYPPGDLIVLQYHQDIPAPDPLSNPDAKSRLFYYRGNHTPIVFLNGFQFDQVGGPVEMTDNVVKTLRSRNQPVILVANSDAVESFRHAQRRHGRDFRLCRPIGQQIAVLPLAPGFG